MNQTNKLFVLRHAKAVDGYSIPDFERELTDKGKRHAALIGQWMLDNACIPESIICSPALRALQTAEIVADILGFEHKQMDLNLDVYNASLQDLLTVLKSDASGCSSILLIGHNPGLANLVEYLSTDVDYSIMMQPSSLACLELHQAWQLLEPASAQLTELIHSKSLD